MTAYNLNGRMTVYNLNSLTTVYKIIFYVCIRFVFNFVEIFSKFEI